MGEVPKLPSLMQETRRGKENSRGHTDVGTGAVWAPFQDAMCMRKTRTCSTSQGFPCTSHVAGVGLEQDVGWLEVAVGEL